MLITFEGVDGSGKTTQALLLYEWLKQQYPVVLTSEPTGTQFGKHVAMGLEQGCDPVAQLYAYAAARAQHVAQVIQPALNRGDIVICDRFSHSTIAYQHFGMGLPNHVVVDVCRYASFGIYPDLILWLDIPAHAALKRCQQRGEAIAVGALDFTRRVSAGYSELFEQDNKARWINAQQSKESIAYTIQWVVGELLENKVSL